MSTPSTISLDTELSAVNSILGSIGQAPVSSLDFDNPEISLIHNLLREINVDVQSEGWHFNSDKNVKTSPDANGHFNVPSNVVRYDITDGQDNKDTNVVIRNGRLYDKYHRTDVFTGDKYIDSVTLFEFGEIPSVFRRYITYRAAGRAATQLIANPQLVQLLGSQEAQARAACIEYECEQGDHNFMGWPDGTSYQAYQPYHGLRRH
tara:strand:- start:435 stop:1052 length:618 start_codon:yes stop_codon:yes gene_type:complete